MRTDREALVLAWLERLGAGPFTYRQIARETGLTRDQALVSCLGLLDHGKIYYVQWTGDFGTDRFELR